MTQPDNSGPSEPQKNSLKSIVKDAVKEILAEERAASTEKQRTTGQPVETEKPKSFFELLGL